MGIIYIYNSLSSKSTLEKQPRPQSSHSLLPPLPPGERTPTGNLQRLRALLGAEPAVKPVRHEIHLVETHKAGALDELPRQEHDQHDGQLDVVADEVDGLEAGAEGGPALHEDQDDIQKHDEDGSVGVGPVLEREEVLEALPSYGGPEAQGCESDGDPGELVRDADDAV